MEAYGPNDTEVLRFLALVSRLTLDQARELIRLRAEADPGALERAGWAVDRAALMASRSPGIASAIVSKWPFGGRRQ